MEMEIIVELRFPLVSQNFLGPNIKIVSKRRRAHTTGPVCSSRQSTHSKASKALTYSTSFLYSVNNSGTSDSFKSSAEHSKNLRFGAGIRCCCCGCCCGDCDVWAVLVLWRCEDGGGSTGLGDDVREERGVPLTGMFGARSRWGSVIGGLDGEPCV